MNLPSDLVSQFAKITKDDKETKKETTFYGTTVDNGGVIYVKLDGSTVLTPVLATTDTKPGERVIVMIKNHTATITGNLSSPAARSDDIKDVADLPEKVANLEKEMITKVTKIDGMGLSQESFTTAEKNKLSKLTNYDDTALSNRVDDIESNYTSKEYVAEQIAGANHLNREIVTSIPTADAAKENVVYMFKVDGATGSDVYQEYQKIGSEVVLIGDTSVDLTGYAKKEDIPVISESHTHDNKPVLDSVTEEKISEWDNKVDKVDGMGLSQENFTTEEKEKLAQLENYDGVDLTDYAKKEDIPTVSNDLTDALKTAYDTAVINSHTHSNKSVLDGITSAKVTEWNKISDLQNRITSIETEITNLKNSINTGSATSIVIGSEQPTTSCLWFNTGES